MVGVMRCSAVLLCAAFWGFPKASLLAQAKSNASEAPREFITSDAFVAVAIRPSELFQNEQIDKLRAINDLLPGGSPEKRLGLAFADFERFTLALTLVEHPNNGRPMPVGVFAWRVAEPAKLLPMVNMLQAKKSVQAVPGLSQKLYVGHPEPPPKKNPLGEPPADVPPADPEAWKAVDAALVFDDRTILYGQRAETLLKTLDAAKSDAELPTWRTNFQKLQRAARWRSRWI
ncbi:MAG: hypothetical protein QM811_30620 [Pirellulales bacterium]